MTRLTGAKQWDGIDGRSVSRSVLKLSSCRRCDKAPQIRNVLGWTVVCLDCYDGAPDSATRSEVGTGLNPCEAIANWNEVQGG